MKILTQAILNKLPKIGDTSELASNEIKVHLKIFNPYGAGTWYITEYDPDTKEAFGYVNLIGSDMAELGYIDMDELLKYRNRMGLGFERDAHFGNHTLDEVMKSGGTI
jgi:hypothetical protein